MHVYMSLVAYAVKKNISYNDHISLNINYIYFLIAVCFFYRTSFKFSNFPSILLKTPHTQKSLHLYEYICYSYSNEQIYCIGLLRYLLKQVAIWSILFYCMITNTFCSISSRYLNYFRTQTFSERYNVKYAFLLNSRRISQVFL